MVDDRISAVASKWVLWSHVAFRNPNMQDEVGWRRLETYDSKELCENERAARQGRIQEDDGDRFAFWKCFPAGVDPREIRSRFVPTKSHRLRAARWPGDHEPQETRSEPDQAPVVKTKPDVGRNDPCPCSSGRKFKRCCLNEASNPNPER